MFIKIIHIMMIIMVVSNFSGLKKYNISYIFFSWSNKLDSIIFHIDRLIQIQKVI